MATKLVLLSRLAAPSEPPQGTRIAAARQDLNHWSRHAADLPWRRRTARREARRKIAAARAELIGAHLARSGLARADRLFTPLLDTRGRGAGAHARSLALAGMRRTTLGRRILLGAALLAAASLASIAAVVALTTHGIAL